MTVISTPQKYFLAAIVFASVSVLSFCNRGEPGNGGGVPKEGMMKILAVYVRPDSTRVLDIVLRQITKTIRYDSVKKRDVIVVDTNFGYPIIVPLIGADGKAIMDSATGKPKFNPQPQYILIRKDSVNTKVENISVDSLLRKR